jgi:tetratricopeptide (TPR) repeat protein
MCCVHGEPLAKPEHAQESIRREADAELEWDPLRATPPEFQGAVDNAYRYLARWLDHHEIEAIDALIRSWNAIIETPTFPAAPALFRADVLNRSAVALQWRAATLHTSAGLDRALERWAEAIRLLPSGDLTRGYFLFNYGSTQLMQYFRGEDPALLDAAITSMRESRRIADAAPRYAALASRGEAAALVVRFRRFGHAADLARAVELAEEAVRAARAAKSRRLDFYRGTLAEVLSHRFSAYGAIDDLQRAIELQEGREAGIHSSTSLDGVLGGLLRQRWSVLGDSDDLDRAIELLHRAVQTGPPDPGLNTEYGNALLARSGLRRDRNDLLASAEAHEAAVAATASGDWQLAGRYNNAGNSRRSLFELTGDSAQRERAAAHYEQAARCCHGPHDMALHLYNLGNALSAPGDGYAPARATESYRRACAAGLEAGVRWALAASQAWGRWAAGRTAWIEAAEAYTVGLDALDRLFRRQLTRDEKETWLRAAVGLADEAAFALTMAGRGTAAVVAAEQGRAHLFSEALELDRVDLQALETMERRDLAERYRIASLRVRRAGEGWEMPSAAPLANP